VVYRETGQGVPYAQLLVRSEGRPPVHFRADQDGAFGPVPSAVTSLQVGLVDHRDCDPEAVRVWHDLEPSPELATLVARVEAWPTLLIESSFPTPCIEDEEDGEHVLDVFIGEVFYGLAFATDAGADYPLWCRPDSSEFDAEYYANFLGYGDQLRLRVACYLCGLRQSSRLTLEPGVLRVGGMSEPEGLAGVAVVLDPETTPDLSVDPPFLVIRDADPKGSVGEFHEQFPVRAGRNEPLKRLDPRTYRLELVRGPSQLWVDEVTLAPGVITFVEPKVDWGAHRSEIAFEVLSTSGRYWSSGELDVVLADLAGDPVWSTSVVWRRYHDEWRAWSSIAAVPPGTYLLRLEFEDASLVSPRELQVTTNGPIARFLIQDKAHTEDLEMVVRGGRDLAPLETGQIELTFEGGSSRASFVGGGVVSFTGLPVGEPFRVRVVAPGHRIQIEEHAGLPPTAADDRSRLVVDLEPGWSSELTVVEVLPPDWGTEYEAAVAGARVFSDGVLVGATDQEGRLRIDLEAPPGHLGVEAPGLRVHPWSLGDLFSFPDDGRTRIQMESDPR